MRTDRLGPSGNWTETAEQQELRVASEVASHAAILFKSLWRSASMTKVEGTAIAGEARFKITLEQIDE